MTEPVPDLTAAASLLRTGSPGGEVVWRSWGAGPVLVLLHGGTGSWRHWAANIADLARGHRVLAPDTPGLGESDMPGEPATPHSIGAHLADGISALIGAETPYDLCGFSYGAMLSGVVAARHGARVRSLTIVGAGALGLPRAQVVLEKVRSRTGQERVEAHRVNLGRFMLARPGRIDDTALAIQDWNTTHARFKSKDFAHTPVLREALAATPAKVHTIWGDRDVTAAPSLQARLDAVRAARADAAITLIPGAGHWVAYDAPDEFAAALRAGLAA